ncbi:MAG: phospholipid carrier-dependent glycosyltransferase [Candidatus Sumerlaeia bacterium]
MKRAALVFLITLATYGLTAAGHLFSPDEEVLFRTTRSLASGEGFAIVPILQGDRSFASRPANPPRPDGREFGQYGIGQPILAVPLVWIGNALARIGSDATWAALYGDEPFGPRDLGIPQTAAELAPRWACSWFNVLLGAAMAALVYLLCLEAVCDARAAMWAALLYALGSMAWPHSRPFFTEPLAAFFLMLAFYGLLRAMRCGHLRWCLVAGCAAGWAFLVRNDSVLAYPGLAVMMLLPIVSVARRRGGSFLAAWIAFAIPVILAGALQLFLNRLHFGNALATGYSDQQEGVKFSTPIIAGLYGYLFSAGKGLFFFSPALILSFFGWKALARRWAGLSRALVWALALMILCPLAIQSTWQNWAGGWCWGPRHVFQIHCFFAVPIAAYLAANWTRNARMAIMLMLAVGAAVQLLGASVNFNRFYQQFFRSPGDPNAYFIMYDGFDQAYWGQYYQLLWRTTPADPLNPIALYPPAPIQQSLYIPYQTMWAGYPVLIRQGQIDNFWLRAATGQTPAGVSAP